MIDIRNLLIFSLTFVIFTIIGTISHEYGHIIVAESLGYETTLRYGSMSYKDSETNDKLFKIFNKNRIAIENNLDFDQKTEYENLSNKLKSERFLITLGGPLQTIITGTIGLIFIFFRRKRIDQNGLRIIDWLAVFLSLFWLREVFNVVISIGNELTSPNGTYFAGDEKNISEFLHFWDGTVSIILAIIGLAISLYIIFSIIPKNIRITFILSGFIGGIVGFILWFDYLGPVLLP